MPVVKRERTCRLIADLDDKGVDSKPACKCNCQNYIVCITGSMHMHTLMLRVHVLQLNERVRCCIRCISGVQSGQRHALMMCTGLQQPPHHVPADCTTVLNTVLCFPLCPGSAWVEPGEAGGCNCTALLFSEPN